MLWITAAASTTPGLACRLSLPAAALCHALGGRFHLCRCEAAKGRNRPPGSLPIGALRSRPGLLPRRFRGHSVRVKPRRRSAGVSGGTLPDRGSVNCSSKRRRLVRKPPLSPQSLKREPGCRHARPGPARHAGHGPAHRARDGSAHDAHHARHGSAHHARHRPAHHIPLARLVRATRYRTILEQLACRVATIPGTTPTPRRNRSPCHPSR
jgi:hypothetical protein